MDRTPKLIQHKGQWVITGHRNDVFAGTTLFATSAKGGATVLITDTFLDDTYRTLGHFEVVSAFDAAAEAAISKSAAETETYSTHTACTHDECDNHGRCYDCGGYSAASDAGGFFR